MNLTKNSWSKKEYTEFINYLFEIRDIKYGKFQGSLGISDVIGIRTPILKKMARDIYKGNYREFLTVMRCEYYEEITLYGFVTADIKNLDESVYYLDLFKKRINNWASCDLFCSSYKIVLKNREFYFNYIENNIKDSNLWIKRLCFVLLISYYVLEERLDSIFEMCDKYASGDYYVQMAVAWLVSICYIKYPKRTIEYIKNNKLDDFTHNKVIAKIRDSHHVIEKDKELVACLRR